MYDELDQLLDKGTYEIVDCSKAIAQNKQVEPTYRMVIVFFHQWNWWFGYDLIVINYVIVTTGGVLLTFLTRVIKDDSKEVAKMETTLAYWAIFGFLWSTLIHYWSYLQSDY